LASAKHHGQDVKCVSNLKQITISGLMYLEESGTTILEADTNDWDSWPERLGPYGVTTNLILCPATTTTNRVNLDGHGDGAASLAWYVWPSATVAPLSGSYSINGWFFSYDPNVNTVNSTWDSPPPSSVNRNPGFVFTKPASIQRPSQTPFCTDAVWWNEWPLEGDAPAQDLSTGAADNITGMPRCTIWRHGGKTATSSTPVGSSMFPPFHTFPNEAAINMGFADGHAQMVKLKDLWSLYWHYNWTPPP
jgi:prepilin-type processing-associated H-X9-DG protein